MDSANAALKGVHQVSDAREEDVGQYGSFQMAAETFDQIQIRTEGGKLIDVDPPTMAVEPVLPGAGMMIARILAPAANPATGKFGIECIFHGVGTYQFVFDAEDAGGQRAQAVRSTTTVGGAVYLPLVARS